MRALPRRLAVHPPPVEPDLAGLRRHRAADQVEDRRLARAVRPDQRRDRALRHGEGRAVDGPHAAEAPLEPLHLEERLGGGRRRGRRRRLALAQVDAGQPLAREAGLAARAPALDPAVDRGDDAPRQEQHDEHEQAAEDQEPRVAAAELVVAGLVQPLDDERAEHRPPERGPPAEQQRQDDLDAQQDVEHPQRVDEADVVAVDAARHPHEDGARHEREDLVGRRAHAHGRGLVLVLADRDQAHAELVAPDPPARPAARRPAGPSASSRRASTGTRRSRSGSAA